ncbi:MAG: hypothetical protein KZQ86_14900 [Candidatus Thiodiazotropha sp. (ex Lucinoma kastoroae)]|nr:hypothetical protein [Candidatus Thiodiazotropha sp. (ex Lucinoma kastoroae)]
MPTDLTQLNIEQIAELNPDWIVTFLKRPVSGSYRNVTPAGYGSILELRVDVDKRRPQERLSGDLYTHFTFCGIPITYYTGSFVVEAVTEAGDSSALVLSGPVIYYADPGNNADTIEVRIPRVGYFASPTAACVSWLSNGNLVQSYVCPKISEYFRTATLEVDRFQGTVFPPTLDLDIDPSPSGLPSSVDIRDTFLRSGIDLTVVHDDLLNDADSNDAEDNWSEAELHDLMEARFDRFSNTLQWNLYSVIVPKFGDPGYNSGYYGTMFDWGGWQAGDTFLRQGSAIAEDAIRGREVDSLYDTSAKKDRLILQTLIHEIGHAFNLPHSWSRSVNPDSGSESFMNYPWGYTDNGGGETNFWSNFRWEFDDPELIWMRHADRNDVIFGGRDWIGNNLSADLKPAFEQLQTPVTLELQGPHVFDVGVPVNLGLKLINSSTQPVHVIDRLQPEEGLLRVIIERPNGDIVAFIPPVRRLMAPPEPFELAPGASTLTSISLSFGAKGHQFAEPGEYLLRVYYPCFPIGFIATATQRIRIAYPLSRGSEELVHLMTSPEAAKFLYYGGSRRDPAVIDKLTEATERYADTDPIAVRHIAAALGRNAARIHKRVDIKKGKRVIVADCADHKTAVEQLTAATTQLSRDYGRDAAFDVVSETRLIKQLADSHMELDNKEKAVSTLESTIKQMKARKSAETAIEDLQRRLKAVKRRK